MIDKSNRSGFIHGVGAFTCFAQETPGKSEKSGYTRAVLESRGVIYSTVHRTCVKIFKKPLLFIFCYLKLLLYHIKWQILYVLLHYIYLTKFITS